MPYYLTFIKWSSSVCFFKLDQQIIVPTQAANEKKKLFVTDGTIKHKLLFLQFINLTLGQSK